MCKSMSKMSRFYKNNVKLLEKVIKATKVFCNHLHIYILDVFLNCQKKQQLNSNSLLNSFYHFTPRTETSLKLNLLKTF